MAVVEIFGHRGRGVTPKGANYSGRPEENTLQAFRQAAALGAHGIEWDAIQAKDNQGIVVHSANLAAHIEDTILTGGTNAFDYTADEIAQMPTGYKGQYRIPKLTAVLRDASLRGVRHNIEYKDTQGTDRAPRTGPSLVDVVLGAIAETEFPLNQVHGSSFSLTTMREVAAKSPQQSIGLLFDLPAGEPYHGDGGLPMFKAGENKDCYLLFNQANIITARRELPGMTALHPEIQSVAEDHVRLAADLGLSLYTWEWRGKPPQDETAPFGRAAHDVVNWGQKHGVNVTLITDYIPEMRQHLGIG